MVTTLPRLNQRLNGRRRKLGMSHAALASRSGVSVPTVKRILSGRAGEASLANVAAVAQALGVSVEFAERDIESMREEQAARKAAQIARMVQGTSALECQGVDAKTYRRLVKQSERELLTGSKRRLWSQ